MAAVRAEVVALKKKLEIEKNDDKIVHALRKLSSLPVTLELLQETGIGKTVRSLRKKPGDVGTKANKIFSKWKDVVTSTGNSSVPVNTNSDSHSRKHEQVSRHHTSQPVVADAKTLKRSYPDDHGVSVSKSKHSTSSHGVSNTQKKTVSSSNGCDPHSSGKIHSSSSSKLSTSDRNGESAKSSSRSSINSHKNYRQEVVEEEIEVRSRIKQEDQKNRQKSHHGRQKEEKVRNEVKNERKRSKLEDVESPVKKDKSSHRRPQTAHKKTKKLLAKGDEDGFDSTMASFEDCLGLNDLKKVVKKRKPTQTPPVMPQPKKMTPVKKLPPLPPPKLLEMNFSPARLSQESDDECDNSGMFSTVNKIINNSAEFDISSTLPTIQPNYKPMRYNSILDSPPRKKKSGLADVDTSIFMSSKHNRTAVFSGRRVQMAAEIPSLYEMCIRILQENVDALEYTGGVPYDQLKPVLERCSPQQLYQIEDYNPYLLEDTDALWMGHCCQDFKGQKPGEFESWREFYLRRYDEREAKLKSITANISASMAKAVPVRQTKLAYVDTVAKPPRNIARQQAKYGTGLPVAIPVKAGPPSKASARPMAPAFNESHNPEPGGSGLKVKKIAPLMQKTLKFMKNRFRR